MCLHAQLCLTLWNPRDITYQVPLPMGLSRQKCWIGLPFIPPVCFHQVKVKVTVVSGSLQPDGLYSPWNSPGQNTGVGSLSLLQGIFPAQGSNPGLQNCSRILYQLRYQGSPYHCFTINKDKIAQGLWGSSLFMCVPSGTGSSALRDSHESSPTFSWNLWLEALCLRTGNVIPKRMSRDRL